MNKLGFGAFLVAMAWSVTAMATVSITDARPDSAKDGHRDSNFSAIIVLADKAVKPDALGQLQTALDAKSPDKDVAVVVSDLRVLDVFPRRAKAGPGFGARNWVMRSLVDVHTDWSAVGDLPVPEDQDSVVCVMSGSIGGIPKQVMAFVPYKLGGMSIMVHSDKHFRAAVTDCIGQLAGQLAGN